MLKNSYYKETDELETLPNIDINIKCGNSLISRYALDADIKAALKKSKWTIDSYRLAVMTYRNAQSKDEKRGMEKLIAEIKSDFESEVSKNDKRYKELNRLKNELLSLTTSHLFDYDAKQKKAWNDKVKVLTEKIGKIETELEEIKNNKIYENAFEWRFEFPEVLNEDGDFVGFDVVIGNPPYFIMTKLNMDTKLLSTFINDYYSIKKSSSKNIFPLFIEKGISLLNDRGYQSFIIPEGLFTTRSYADCVSFMELNGTNENITTIEGMVFDEANTGNVIFVFGKNLKSVTRNFNFNVEKVLDEIIQVEDSIIKKVYNLKGVIALNRICELFKGMVVQDRKSHVFDEWNNDLIDKFLLGNCISKWVIKSTKYTDYSKLIIIGGTKKKSKHQTFPRILIRRTGNFLCCAYLEEAALTESTLYSCWSKTTEIDNKYILSLLHSKLFDYIIKKSMVTNKQAFPQILMTDLESF